MTGPGKCDVAATPVINSTLARGLVVRIASWAAAGIPVATTSGRTSVADSAVSVLLLSANPGRISFSVFNDSTAILYLGFGTVAVSTTNYTVQIQPGGYYEPPVALAAITSEVRGIWATDPNTGAARLTAHSA